MGCWREPWTCQNGLSLSIWMRFTNTAPDNISSSLGILSTMTATDITCGVYITEWTNIYFGMRNHNRAMSDYALFSYPEMNKWTHYVMTLKVLSSDEKPDYKIYENGKSKTFTVHSKNKNSQPGSCNKIVFGRKYTDEDGSYGNNVKIDELLIFDNVLTESQVLTINNA